ncbi:hypothetical protein RCH09_002465 [Actimicrobium sp. GrIS 1.19]|uniref:hypothetical protein n=1 Tax=Actimicrobium sp. GrIS 1.19 TaxID=3071708 RepID=UPI002E062C08|nr:hypothetical protein [Actimicrobium sp. GrIS 1.19]
MMSATSPRAATSTPVPAETQGPRRLNLEEIQRLVIFEPGKNVPSRHGSFGADQPPVQPAGDSPAQFASAETRAPGVPILPHADVHFHLLRYDGRGLPLPVIVEWAKQNNIRHLLLSAISTPVVSLLGDERFIRQREQPGCCGDSYYLSQADMAGTELTAHQVHERQQQIELLVDSSPDWHQIQQYKRLPPEDPDMIDIAMTGLNLGDPRAYLSFLRNLDAMDVDIASVGEVTLQKEMVMYLIPNRSQADLDENIKPMYTLLQTVGTAGMALTMHCDMDSALVEASCPRHPGNLAGVVKLLDDPQTQDTTIIWAHCGGVNRFGPVADKHCEYVDQLLSQHPNLMIDLSWSRVASKLDPARLAELVKKHPTRFLMGSDALAPEEPRVMVQTYEIYARPGGLFQRLSADELNQVLLQNYQRVIHGSKENGKKFKQHVLPLIRDLLTDPNANGFRPDELHALTMRIFQDVDPAHFEKLTKEAADRHTQRAAGVQLAQEHGPLVPALTQVVETAGRPRYINTRRKLDLRLGRLIEDTTGAEEHKTAQQSAVQAALPHWHWRHAGVMREIRLRHEAPAHPAAPPIQVVDEEENQRCGISCLQS